MNRFILILLLPMLGISLAFNSRVNKPKSIILQENYTSKALEVLEGKCNTCHLKKSRSNVFTKGNMLVLAPKINEQVFIKEKMPKRKGEPLTEKEKVVLKNWLNKALP